MHHFYPDRLSELERKKIQDQMAAIRLEQEALNGQPKWLDKNLAMLGSWMVDKGEKLRQRPASLEKGSRHLLRGGA